MGKFCWTLSTPKILSMMPAQQSLRLGQPHCLCCIPTHQQLRGRCHKTHPKLCNIFHFHWFFYPLCRHPWLSAWWSLPNQVIAFIISKRVIAQHLFQIVHCISVDKTQQHQRLQNPNWVWGKKKRGDEFNGWSRINSANYASAWTCFRSNLLTIIIFSISATVVELNGKLFWIPL